VVLAIEFAVAMKDTLGIGDHASGFLLNEVQVTSFASALLDVAGRLQRSDHLAPRHSARVNLALGYFE
jgi:hypothetical protein